VLFVGNKKIVGLYIYIVYIYIHCIYIKYIYIILMCIYINTTPYKRNKTGDSDVAEHDRIMIILEQ
jgi:hypothetical protein